MENKMTINILKLLKKDNLKPCSQCVCAEFELIETMNANGLICYPYFCKACGSRSPICEKKAMARSIGFIPL